MRLTPSLVAILFTPSAAVPDVPRAQRGTSAQATYVSLADPFIAYIDDLGKLVRAPRMLVPDELHKEAALLSRDPGVHAHQYPIHMSKACSSVMWSTQRGLWHLLI
jgi:hypothetical protein